MRPERRAHTRFVLELEVRYATVNRRGPSGHGTTRDLSTTDVSFAADGELPVGMYLELQIAWPVTLESGQQLNFVVIGPIVRSDGRIAVIRIRRHQFRTHSDSAYPEQPV